MEEFVWYCEDEWLRADSLLVVLVDDDWRLICSSSSSKFDRINGSLLFLRWSILRCFVWIYDKQLTLISSSDLLFFCSWLDSDKWLFNDRWWLYSFDDRSNLTCDLFHSIVTSNSLNLKKKGFYFEKKANDNSVLFCLKKKAIK